MERNTKDIMPNHAYKVVSKSNNLHLQKTSKNQKGAENDD